VHLDNVNDASLFLLLLDNDSWRLAFTLGGTGVTILEHIPDYKIKFIG